jgi:endonuclease-3
MADAVRITQRLLEAYPNPRIALRFTNPLQLLVATLLSAQCTDARVNAVTEGLFKRYRSVQDYARADLKTLEQAIRPTGFYRSKARTLIHCCQALAERYANKVPGSMEDLVSLPGVGRKTAAIVLGSAYHQDAIAVDTHVLRVSNRLGLTHSRDAEKLEQGLMAQVPKDKWTPFTLAMILHGRERCTARKPRCGDCPLFDLCEWGDKPARGA